ncbi:hypothetical protein LCI18_013807 [Fusarium solani-melongenae]|uniref:Uncharacterized protein n=1 Tax=Fusarium solani subsp. cucurbitae TaxID=2747967 RepID=A0ACD3ZNV3_FUSSC|nr:hypothetical protein LCI18_013807 [Fusarium solani-melongenae]
MAPFKFGPENAIGAYEGNLLLYWYLYFARSCLPQVESRSALSAQINESFAEVAELRLEVQDQLLAQPLAAAVELLSDSSVWKWPSGVSLKLEFLIEKFKAADSTNHVATSHPPLIQAANNDAPVQLTMRRRDNRMH